MKTFGVPSLKGFTFQKTARPAGISSGIFKGLFDKTGGSAGLHGVRWSESFVVLGADTPVEKIKRSLGPAKYAVLVKKDPSEDKHFVVRRDELELASRELGLGSVRRHVLYRRSTGHRFGRNPRVGNSLHDFGIEVKTIAKVDSVVPWSKRMVQLDGKGRVTAVGVRVRNPGATGQAFLKPAKERSRPVAVESRQSGRSSPASKVAPPAGPGRRVREASAASAPPADEATDIVRHPAVEPRGPAVAGQLLQVEVDLLRDRRDRQTESEGVRIAGLPDDWKWIDVDVKLHSPELRFEEGDGEGRVRVRRNQASTPHVFSALVSPAAEGKRHVEVLASFWYNHRSCGTAVRRVPLQAGSVAEPRVAPPPPAPRRIAAATFRAIPGAESPVLTVKIYPQPFSSPQSKRLFWDITVSRRDVAGLPDTFSGEVNLNGSPAAFVDRLLAQTFGRKRGRHALAMKSFGQLLFDAAPLFFRQAYWALRRACRESCEELTIQFISYEPRIPWELMYPHQSPDGEQRVGFLAAEHRVARWLGHYEGRLRNRYPRGRVFSVVPRYTGKNRLASAEKEGELLRSVYDAVNVPATWDSVTQTLEQGTADPVSIFHFAGHGEYDAKTPEGSAILLEDERLSAIDVRNTELAFARHHPLVLFNACEVGNVGFLLNHMAGWAESFLYGGFGGVVAPVWTVYDEEATEIMIEFLEMVIKRELPVSEALRAIRHKSANLSPTFLAYLYYGDVTARIADADPAVH